MSIKVWIEYEAPEWSQNPMILYEYLRKALNEDPRFRLIVLDVRKIIK